MQAPDLPFGMEMYPEMIVFLKENGPQDVGKIRDYLSKIYNLDRHQIKKRAENANYELWHNYVAHTLRIGVTYGIFDQTKDGRYRINPDMKERRRHNPEL